ncbi:MAG: UDP-N-acetylmuramoyl-L-alanine--D-glutamate ligase [Defluviitaleaceae bacterium]|nr:UDP-N-acetylmuramoyl-L-alanine--D-glutamate ligase [Defluviitaleaceae bacterium]
MFKDMKILVCGMARSGIAAARLLREMGAAVTLQDMRAEAPADVAGFEVYLGRNPDDIVQDFDLIIISPGISIYEAFVQKAEALGIPVWGETELAYRLCPCPMVAITGTNGKTTVTTLVGEIMRLKNPGTVIAGNIGTPLTALVNTLNKQNLVVAEISSFQLETIEAFKPAIATVLNMTEDHLDRHKTMENYIAMKSRIFENQGQNDVTVLNLDNVITCGMRPPGRVVYFSAKEEPQCGVFLRGGDIISNMGENETTILNISQTKVIPENALAATALSLLAGATPQMIATVLKSFAGVPHRLEHIASIGGVNYYNDSKATNTDAAITALNSFREPVVLIGGGFDKQADFTPWVELFPAKVSYLILIGQTGGQIAKACEEIGFTAHQKAATLEEAVNIAKNLAKPGQNVVFSPACASFDMFKNFEERGELFTQYVKASQ